MRLFFILQPSESFLYGRGVPRRLSRWGSSSFFSRCFISWLCMSMYTCILSSFAISYSHNPFFAEREEFLRSDLEETGCFFFSSLVAEWERFMFGLRRG